MRNVREAAAASWTHLTDQRDMDALYPLALGTALDSIFRSRSKRGALRLRIVAGAKSGHGHLIFFM